MTVGEKIKKIPNISRYDAKDWALCSVWGPVGQDNRIAQYETNYRVPKAELLDGIAGALNVNPQKFL